MIDYLVRFDDESQATKALPEYRIGDLWNTSTVIPGCKVYIVTGTTEDEEGNPVEVRQYLPYWYLWIAIDREDEFLAQMSMVVANREERKVLMSRIPEKDWGLYNIEPVIAGSDYPFGLGSADNG